MQVPLDEEKRLKQELENKLQIEEYRLLNLKKVLANSRILTVGEKYAADVMELAKTLNLPKIPQRIEGYDVSNIFGREAVGSMVVFTDGLIDKNQYRKFKIKTVKGADDIASLKEILSRRLNHQEWPYPELILLPEQRFLSPKLVKVP